MTIFGVLTLEASQTEERMTDGNTLSSFSDVVKVRKE